MRFIALAFLLLPLSGCVFGNLEQLKLLDPQADDFETALAAEYLAFATAESEQDRSLSAEYFAAKGMAAWRGEDVPPETVSTATAKPLKYELQATRELLLALLADDVKAVVPQPAARAQLLFDCWVKQAGAYAKNSELCVDELQSELATLEDVAASLGYASETTKRIAFNPGSAKLGKRASRQLRAIALSLEQDVPYILELAGETGSARNAQLFKRRVAEIRKAFYVRGVGNAHIRLQEPISEKTVYLSNDSIMKESNTVTVIIRSFNPPSQEES